uniref:ATP synthase F0 subunit 6 n=1 Tax=Vibidia duodecimguttata TaxID=420103 RepID=UPI0021B545BC|nr:ATP synthase F0 subunit 6 [Vibidia duodecimguttata]UVU20930.1 ATP synthase F0 subunit 6 [Vibidia duodecimguttata]
MMTNLFSTFDPSTLLYTQLNWMSMMISFMIIPSLFWLIPNRMNFLVQMMLMKLHMEFKILTKNNNTLIFISLFFFILINNFMGLFPYIFTSSSHLVFTLSFALPLWLSFMIFGWLNNTYYMFAHLMPQGTPPVLMPFMVCIETISNVIRPGTLAIRLSANMIAGHLLLTLLGNTGTMVDMLIFIVILVQFLLIILESAVAIIQSYVFAILSTLYSSETS